jgi:hypothetical protein
MASDLLWYSNALGKEGCDVDGGVRTAFKSNRQSKDHEVGKE